MTSLQASYSMNQVFLNGLLPDEVEAVYLRPTSATLKAVDTAQKEKFIFLNSMARRLRHDRAKPLITDVSENCVVILPYSEAEGKHMVERGLDRRDLEPAEPPSRKIGVRHSLYQRLLLRAFEISLRQKGYMVDEVTAAKYEYASTSFAYVYSSGQSATNNFFEVYRGVAFRVMVYPRERRAGLLVDPTFRLIPRATINDFAKSEHRNILKKWGGREKNGEIIFEPRLEVTDVCPISPEVCGFRKSPFQSECLLYNSKYDMAVSWPRQALLISIKKEPITGEPRIRDSVKNCATISSHIPDNTPMAAVTFYGSENTYSYPLQRLRMRYSPDLIPEFVTVLGGNEQDIRTMRDHFERIVKLPPNERRFYTDLFVNDLSPFPFGRTMVSFEKSLVKVSVKPWKQEPS